MPCEQWYKFLERYRRSVKIYNKAVEGLSGSDFNAAWQSAEAALKSSGAARAMLLGHEHEHACASGDWDVQELVLGDQGQSGG